MIGASPSDKNHQRFFGDDHPLTDGHPANTRSSVQQLPSYLAQGEPVNFFGQPAAVDPYPNKCSHCVQKKIKQRENMRTSLFFLPNKVLDIFLPSMPPIFQGQKQPLVCSNQNMGSPDGQSTPNPSRAHPALQQLNLSGGMVEPMKSKAGRQKNSFSTLLKLNKPGKKSKTKSKEKPMFHSANNSPFSQRRDPRVKDRLKRCSQ